MASETYVHSPFFASCLSAVKLVCFSCFLICINPKGGAPFGCPVAAPAGSPTKGGRRRVPAAACFTRPSAPGAPAGAAPLPQLALRRHVRGENSSTMGNTSSRPASIANDSSSLENGEYAL